MKLRKLTLVLGLVSIASCMKYYAPQIDGKPPMIGEQGSDTKPIDYNSAWFSGDNIVHYCYSLDKNFGVTQKTIEEELRAAFQTWRDYIITKQINSRLAEGGGQGKMTTESILLPECNGTEDLTFYFGVRSDEVQSIRKNYLNPLAFAFRTTYNAQKGWGKGFVYLAYPGEQDPDQGVPDWTIPFRLRAVLIHEIGHTYGVPHVEGTIMQRDLTPFFYKNFQPLDPPKAVEYELTHIDSKADLFLQPFKLNELTLSGSIEECVDCEPAHQQATFEFFAGRKPSGSITARLQQDTLVLTDSIGDVSFQIQLDPNSYTAGEDIPIFQIYRELGEKQPGSLKHQGQIFMGETQTKSGAHVSLEIDRNMGGRNSRPLWIYYLSHGVRQNLFVGEWPWWPN